MLNTDHHRANLEHPNRRMTQEQFLKQVRGIDQGHDIDADYVIKIFLAVTNNAMELAFDDSNDMDVKKRGKNTAMTKTGRTRGRRRSVMDNIYDTFVTDRDNENAALNTRERFLRDMSTALRNSEDMLRSMRAHIYRFQLTGVDTNISLDLVSYMFETVWFHFRSLSGTVPPSLSLSLLCVAFF